MEAPEKELTRLKTALFIKTDICISRPLIVFDIFGADFLFGIRFPGNACIYGNSIDCALVCLDSTRSHSTNVIIPPMIVVLERGAEAVFLRVLFAYSMLEREIQKEICADNEHY